MFEFESILFCPRLVVWFRQVSELICSLVSGVVTHPFPDKARAMLLSQICSEHPSPKWRIELSVMAASIP